MVEYSAGNEQDLRLSQRKNARLIAFYLPQFHPIPENDRWWGKNFTDWMNVAKAKPLFPDHFQPHESADLGYYDLRRPEVRQAQADLARQYGIYGFCYYHYWFHGRRLLAQPFDEVLASGKPDFPFCLCWANENWTRTWDGREEDILVEQTYSEEDDHRHMGWLASVFRDERYIRVKNKPLFLVYRALELPNPVRTVSIWREEAKKKGVGEIFLCRVESFPEEHGDPIQLGFDASVEFQPDWSVLGMPSLITPFWKGLFWYLIGKAGVVKARCRYNKVYQYALLAKKMLRKPAPSYLRFPCVTPSWDNSSRRKVGAIIFHKSTPALYEKWLAAALETVNSRSESENVVFINAWNEWGEGCHLEPDQRWGRAYLEGTRRALEKGATPLFDQFSQE